MSISIGVPPLGGVKEETG